MNGDRLVSIHHREQSCRCPHCLQSLINRGPDLRGGYYQQIGRWANAAMELRRAVPAPTRLDPAMLPLGMWQVNVRYLLTTAEWEYLRIALLDDAGDRCEVCGAPHSPTAPLECHEMFTWDHRCGRARLARILVLCRLCHRTQHLGLAAIHHQLEDVLLHLRHLNDWQESDLKAALARTASEWAYVGSRRWLVDFDAIGLDPSAQRVSAGLRRAARKNREIERRRVRDERLAAQEMVGEADA